MYILAKLSAKVISSCILGCKDAVLCRGMISDPQWIQASLPVSKGGTLLEMELASTYSQREMSALSDGEAHHCLVEAARDMRERARLQCVDKDGAGDWMGVLPGKGLGLPLRKDEFCMAGKYRLGMPFVLL